MDLRQDPKHGDGWPQGDSPTRKAMAKAPGAFFSRAWLSSGLVA